MKSSGFQVQVSDKEISIQTFIENEYDHFSFKNAQFDFLIEGILLNKKKLLTQFALSDFETLITKIYQQKGEHIIKEFEGEFRGYIYDKLKQKIFVFTNPTATQKVFYAKFENQIFVDTNLIRLHTAIKEKGILLKPNLESIYQILTIGNVLEKSTPIEGVKKLLDGHLLKIDLKNICFEEKCYFNLYDVEYYPQSKNHAVDSVHEIFSEGILMEYKKDNELNSNHFTLLSGGLDSRIAMFYAIKNNIKPDLAFCFSQSNYFDETISRKIAEDYKINYEFVPLDKGFFLKKIDQLTAISQGMSAFTGGLHVQHAVEHLKFRYFKIFHGGAIGDGILGGFNSRPKKTKPSDFKIISYSKFKHKIESSLRDSQKMYETEEPFLLRNLAFSKTVLGAEVFQQKSYQTSPFMTKDFMKLALSLPEEWKYGHRFYLAWISKHCTEATKYRWERTLMRPNEHWKTFFGDKFVKRSFRIFNENILKMPQKASMYPYQYYFDSSKEIQDHYQKYFDENIELLQDYKELQKEIHEIFISRDYFLKAKAVNVLSIFKLYFKE